MVSFVAGKPVTTDTPGVLVDAGLAAGRHRFRLVVSDNGGTLSQPSEIVVQIQRLVVPPVGPLEPPVIVRPPIVDPGPTIPIGPVVTGQPSTPVRPLGAAPAPRRRKP